MIDRAVGVDRIDGEQRAGVNGGNKRLEPEFVNRLDGDEVGQIIRAGGHEFERPNAAQPVERLTRQRKLRRPAVEVPSHEVAGLGPHFQRHSGHPVREDGRKLVLNRNGSGLLDGLGKRVSKLKQPALSGRLKSPPLRVVPVDDPRGLGVVLASITGDAVRAVADARPDDHVVENAFKIVVADQFLSQRQVIVANRRIDASVTVASFQNLVFSLLGLESPVRVLLETVVVPHHVKVRHRVETAALALFHDLSKVVPASHPAVHLADLGPPQAEPRA